MLVTSQIGFSYDCRRCDKQVQGSLELFPLSARRMIVRCDCGESALVAQLMGSILLVEYPCSICGLRHRVSIPIRTVLGNDMSILYCPITELPACFLGNPDTCHTLSEESALLAGLKAALENQTAIPSAADVLCTAKDLAEKNRIRCRCGTTRIRAGYEAGILELTCCRCGACKQVSIRTAEDLRRLRSHLIIL